MGCGEYSLAERCESRRRAGYRDRYRGREIIVVALPKTLEAGEDAPSAVPGPEFDEGGTVEGPAEESIVEVRMESEPVHGEEPTGVDGSVDEVENQWKA